MLSSYWTQSCYLHVIRVEPMPVSVFQFDLHWYWIKHGRVTVGYLVNQALIFTLVAFAGGCASEDESAENLDLNSDGVDDIDYEFSRDEYVVLTDRNFDGYIDEKIRLDRENVYLGGTSDDNFDKVFETRMFAENGLVSHVAIDTNLDGWVDQVEYYEDGVVKSATRYYPELNSSESAMLGRIDYEYGYPMSAEEVESTQETLQEFHQRIDAIDGIKGNVAGNESAEKLDGWWFR